MTRARWALVAVAGVAALGLVLSAELADAAPRDRLSTIASEFVGRDVAVIPYTRSTGASYIGAMAGEQGERIYMNEALTSTLRRAPGTPPRLATFALSVFAHEIGHFKPGGVPVGAPNGRGGYDVTVADWDRAELSANAWGRRHAFAIALRLGYSRRQAVELVRAIRWRDLVPWDVAR